MKNQKEAMNEWAGKIQTILPAFRIILLLFQAHHCCPKLHPASLRLPFQFFGIELAALIMAGCQQDAPVYLWRVFFTRLVT